ncbi:hypothetical protein BASA81_002423 [Batrachochytrium salamandrivorans]|nr:hypothetical protein BASA81_002423 [Batrachochytrium salamandrivorans]
MCHECETRTSQAQRETEEIVLEAFARTSKEEEGGSNELFVQATKEYLESGLLGRLNPGFSSLDASKPWLCYWMLHALSLLGADHVFLDDQVADKVIATLNQCQNAKSGGYGGGYLQLAHTAPTYAGVMALVTLNSKPALRTINRGTLYRYFLSLKLSDGGFQVHEDGESDSRAMYTVLAVASLTNMLTTELTDKCLEWIATTQGFDGGFGGEPGNESHGGYAFCTLASLVLLHNANCELDVSGKVDLDALAHWLAFRQMQVEGGFQGRTNKLVDSCYSFWQGASFQLINRLGSGTFPQCNSDRLLRYVFGACRHEYGGLKDKPDTGRDYYHTCYSLSGVSVADHAKAGLRETDPVFNVTVDKLSHAKLFFARQPSSHQELMSL